MNKKEEERASRCVYRNTSVSSCTECPGAYPAYTMFSFLLALSLSLSLNNRRSSFFYVCVVSSFFEVLFLWLMSGSLLTRDDDA